MQPSKNVAVGFLLGSLLVGGALGFTADRVMARDRICVDRSTQAGMREYLARRLHLTSTQRLAVDSILDKRHRDVAALLAPARPQLDSVKNAARIEIGKLLTADQQPLYRELIEESKREEAGRK